MMQFPRLMSWACSVMVLAILAPLPMSSSISVDTSNTLPPLVHHSQQLRALQTNNPLGLCHGDCNSDADCADDLVCFQRSANQTVPGCSGTPKPDVDYCVNPKIAAVGTHLRLYWEKNYLWQGSDQEVQWCMGCQNGVCFPGSYNYLIECIYEGRAVRFVLVKVNGLGPQPHFRMRQAGDTLCLELTADRDKYAIFQPCDSNLNNPYQLWYAQNGDPFTNPDKPFEIVPKIEPERCLTITHHPTRNETVWASTCPWARNNSASFWIKD